MPSGGSVELGSLADWLSAGGTLLAVLAALWIAGLQQRDAKRARIRAEQAERQRHIDIIDEAVRLLAEVDQIASSLSQLVKLGGGGGLSHKLQLIEIIAGIRRQLEALQQQFPLSEPRLFAELGRAAHDCRLEEGIEEKSSSYLGEAARQLAERARSRQNGLAALR